MTTPSFAVIAEGPCDYQVLRHVLAGYFRDPDIVVAQLQPPVDASGSSGLGGWHEVLQFIASDRFVSAFERSEVVVIHIDTDVCEEPHFAIRRKAADGRELSTDELIERTIERLVALMGPAVYEQFGPRIVFAIAVDSVECWLLPLYYGDGRREKTTLCIRSLNEALARQERFTIDVNYKQAQYYTKISRAFTKWRRLRECAPHNPSLARLVSALERRFPVE
jgi:hypothetical protein